MRPTKLLLTYIIALSISSTALNALNSADVKANPDEEAAGRLGKSKHAYSPPPINEEQKTKLKTPLYNLFTTTNFKLFVKELEIKFSDTKTCGKGILDKAVGLKAHMIEPVGYFETTPRPFHFPFANFDINIKGDTRMEKILKSGSTKTTRDDEFNGREQLVYSHFVYVPLMHMIVRKQTPLFCFATGSISIPFVSEIFPFYKKGVMYKNLVPQMMLMMSPQGVISMILDCSATMGSSMLNHLTALDAKDSFDFSNFDEDKIVGDLDQDSYKSKLSDLGEKGLSKLYFIRNTMFWSAGCLGPRPVGGYIDATNPITDSDLLAYGALNLLHGASALMKKPFFQKQTNFGMHLGKSSPLKKSIQDTMCAPKDFPILPPTQYVLQRVYPTVGKPHEMGEPGASHTVAGNVPGSKGEVASIVWMRRDYAAGAYYCPGSGGSK